MSLRQQPGPGLRRGFRGPLVGSPRAAPAQCPGQPSAPGQCPRPVPRPAQTRTSSHPLDAFPESHCLLLSTSPSGLLSAARHKISPVIFSAVVFIVLFYYSSSIKLGRAGETVPLPQPPGRVAATADLS